MKNLILGLVLSLLAAPALAQTTTTSLNLAWTAPTQNTDGTSITSTLTYQVFQGPKAGPFVPVGTPVSTTTSVISSVAAGNCFAVETIETTSGGSTTSSLSSTACAEVPSPATGLTITFTITVH